LEVLHKLQESDPTVPPIASNNSSIRYETNQKSKTETEENEIFTKKYLNYLRFVRIIELLETFSNFCLIVVNVTVK
jgi:hypothetical protein